MSKVASDLREYLKARVWFPQQQGSHELLTLYLLLAASTRTFRESPSSNAISGSQGRTIFSIFPAIPYLYFQGPPGSGKTEAGDLMAALTGGKSSASITPAALFRWLNENIGKLMFLDEASGLSKQDHVEIFNAGYNRNGRVHRCVAGSLKIEPFNVFGPKIFAANTRLPLSAVETRCIPVDFAVSPMDFLPLDRKRAQEKSLRKSAREWVRTNADAIRTAHKQWRGCKDTSIFTTPRTRQIYSPLFAIAEVAGMLESVRDYAVAHQEQRAIREDLSIGNRLDKILEGLPEFCRMNNLPKDRIPFPEIRQFVSQNMNGLSLHGRAISNGLKRAGYKELGSRPGGVTCYSAPPSGVLAKVRDKLSSMVGQKPT